MSLWSLNKSSDLQHTMWTRMVPPQFEFFASTGGPRKACSGQNHSAAVILSADNISTTIGGCLFPQIREYRKRLYFKTDSIYTAVPCTGQGDTFTKTASS